MTLLLQPAYPQMVQGLHGAFFSHVRMGMAASPYLDAAAREDLESLFEGGAHPREFADEVLFSVTSGWARMAREKGVNVEVRSTFGIEPLFAPMEKGNIIACGEGGPTVGRKADAAVIAREISHHHASANRYLEIRYPVGTPGLETFFIVHSLLNVYGLHLYAMPDHDVIVRMPSLTFFESLLKYCLGKRALTPCFAPGEVPPDTFNALHKSGHHALGQPLQRRRMHGRVAEPADYTLHDLGHLIEASVHLSVVEQRAASLFYETASAFLKGDYRLRQVWALLSEDFAHLNDLDITPADDRTLAGIMAKTSHLLFTIYGQPTVDRLFALYRTRIEKFFKTDAKKDADLRRELQAFLAEVENIRTGRAER